jgi:DNA ligase-associated metallophosphoesterase
VKPNLPPVERGEHVEYAVGATRLALLPERAAWVDAARMLLIADLHLGKASSFRRHGVPVPEATTADNLERLSLLCAAWQPRCIAFLGDFLHAPESRAASTLDALAAWRRDHAHIVLLLVRGNHDRRAGDPPAWLGASCVDEPHGIAGARGLHLSHYPRRVDGTIVVAGHVHPCAVAGRGFERVRLPCFHAAEGCLTLPAFGAFTGMHPIERAEGDRVFVVAGDRVVELPARGGPSATARSS